MIHFKHLNRGMSLIEVMAAIAILAIFGSSLFMMQAYLFERLMIAEKKIVANLRLHSELIAYETRVLQELFAQEKTIDKILQEHTQEFQHPDMTIKITTQLDFKETSLKNFSNLYLLQAQAEHDQKEYGKLYKFIYIPEAPKK